MGVVVRWCSGLSVASVVQEVMVSSVCFVQTVWKARICLNSFLEGINVIEWNHCNVELKLGHIKNIFQFLSSGNSSVGDAIPQKLVLIIKHDCLETDIRMRGTDVIMHCWKCHSLSLCHSMASFSTSERRRSLSVASSIITNQLDMSYKGLS